MSTSSGEISNKIRPKRGTSMKEVIGEVTSGKLGGTIEEDTCSEEQNAWN